MDHATLSMHVVETEKDLLCDLFDEVHGNTFILMTFDETEEVFAEDFEDHADVGAILSLMSEMIKEGDNVSSTLMRKRMRTPYWEMRGGNYLGGGDRL